MQIDMSGPWGKGMKRSVLGVRRSKINVIEAKVRFAWPSGHQPARELDLLHKQKKLLVPRASKSK